MNKLLYLMLLLTTNCFAISFDLNYSNDRFFESCLNLDSSNIANNIQRFECWRNWLTNHRYGQSDDKIRYAILRTKQLRGK